MIISYDKVDYSVEKVANVLIEFRVKISDGNHHFLDKIGNAHDMNIPYTFIVEPDEKAHDDKVASLRDRQERETEGVAQLDRAETIL